ncbi:YadA-like family protein [Pasteurella atlantica]|uniref:YadA-like family protein n=1 Tax=Pasteurellaceae TaxID=712 RepID=UPI00275B6750|nr:YadA-like family protein [Pasteurella atlantica]MDP8034398.1 YadA-like family protein [Pasteurella atlantica]MDP8036293.1 YadA-like family protein [Pasteurella atlantica]MDP8038281.1 YadA-like family protein [Pasteurella atlantica]MDP8048634.1 YadA-like family protein [Pasteurella atlantica]MDP8050555.1 YadA-like family protein [Pasteurella atlantica]
MNKIFKVVFNQITQTYTVTSELVKNGSKSHTTGNFQSSNKQTIFSFKFTKIAIMLSSLFVTTVAMAEAGVDGEAGTTTTTITLGPDKLYVDGSNVGKDSNKSTFGKNVGKTTITGDGTQLVQEQAVKTYVDAVDEKVTNIEKVLNTKLNASNIKNITSLNKSVVIGSNKNVLAGDVDLRINVDGSTIKVNKDGQLQAVASAPEVDGTSIEVAKGKVSVKDKGISAAKLADNAVTEDKIADALLTELKAKSREKVKAGAGIKVSPTTVAADKDNQEFTVSLSDSVATKLGNLANNANATYLNTSGSNIGDDAVKSEFGKNTGKTDITGNGTQLVQENAVKTYVDNKAIELGAQIVNVSKTLKEEVAVKPNSGLTLATVPATTKKGTKYTLGLNSEKIKEIAGTMNKADKNAENLSDENIKAWITKLNTGANLTVSNGKLVTDTQVKTALNTKLNADAIQNITSSDQSVRIGTNKNVATGEVDLKINVDGTSVEIKKGQVSLKDSGVSTVKLVDNAVTKDKIADELLKELKTKSREKVKAGTGIKVSLTKIAANTDNQEFIVSLSNDITSKLENLADNANITYLNKTGSNIGNDKLILGQNVGKNAINGSSTQLVQEKAVKTYVDTEINNIGKGKNGKDGYIGVEDKNGKNRISIDGKDGITVKGKNGKSSISINGDNGIGIKDSDGKTLVTIGKEGNQGIIGLQGASDKNNKFYNISIQNGKNDVDGIMTDRIVYVDKTTKVKKEVATVDDGLAFTGDTGAKNVKLNKTLTIKGGVKDKIKLSDNNVGVVANTNGLEVKLAKNLTGISSIASTTGGSKLTLSDKERSISVNGGRVTNLGDAIANGDAVNYRQLKEFKTEVKKDMAAITNDLKEVKAGVSSAMASALLPQAYKPGQSMLSLAGATYKQSNSIAIGLSTISNNGKWLLKGALNTDTTGQVGGGVGVGYAW